MRTRTFHVGRMLGCLGILLLGLTGCQDGNLDESSVAPPVQRSAIADARSLVLMQGFHWESHEQRWWNLVAAQAPDIAAAGIDMVWLPPSGGTASDEGYLPHRLYYQNSQYGTQDELKRAIRALGSHGVRALADVVINHRIGSSTWADFTEPAWGPEAVCRDDEWPYARGNQDTGERYTAARDIDHTQPFVQRDIIAWLNWMKSEMGYAGWRYDLVKGYSPYYIHVYNQGSSPFFSVGEYWDGDRQHLCDWVNGTNDSSAVFDFATMYQLKRAVLGNYGLLRDAQDRPSGMIGWWGQMAVTFLDNHDMGPRPYGHEEGELPFPGAHVMQGYAYILTHPGVPTIWWPHFYDWGLHDEIKALIGLRKAQGLTATSSVSIRAADQSKYAAIIDNKVAMKIGPGDWSPGAGWQLAASGNRYAVWTREAAPQLRTVIFIRKETSVGQDIFIRGGHDAQLVRSGLFAGLDEPISYVNRQNLGNATAKAGDATLDWGSDSILDWTCKPGTCAWHEANGITYATHGYGVDPENTRGQHWWKFDVITAGQPGDWFEFKAFLRQGATTQWENDITQPGAPYASHNHWAKKGFVTFVQFGQPGAEFQPLP